MILLFIQLIIPFVNILMEYTLKWVKRGVVRCNEDATQVCVLVKRGRGPVHVCTIVMSC